VSDPDATSGGIFPWLKKNVTAAIAVAGILLYAVFSIPATFFYAHLGTTPSEVGSTYTSLLSGSTLAVLIILAAVIVLPYYFVIGFSAGFILGYYLIVVPTVAFMFLVHPRLLAKDQELEADEFELKLQKVRILFCRRTWKEEVKPKLSRHRDLSRKKSITDYEDYELKSLDPRKIYLRGIASPFSVMRSLLRPPAKFIYSYLAIMIVISTVALAMIARHQADQLRQGNTYFGHEIGLLGYHAEKVDIRPSIDPAKGLVQQEDGVFLLGQTAQYVVVYSPRTQSTKRIPVAAAIVTNSPE